MKTQSQSTAGSLPTSEPTTPSTHVTSPTIRPQSSTRIQRLISHLKDDIDLTHADIPIITTSFVTGILDSSAYNAFQCFVGMQTGNTVILALGASALPAGTPYGWLKSLISIVFFLIGCFCFGLLRKVGPMRRGVLAASFMVQAVLVFVAAALVQSGVVPAPNALSVVDAAEVDFMVLIPIALLAFQSGGQIVTSRQLAFNEIPTIVLTSVYCDIASDPNLIEADNVKRNRRVAAVVCVLTGGIAGGWINRSQGGLAAAIWTAGAIKVIISLAWLGWRGKSSIQI